MRHIPGLYISYNEKGRGVYTAESIEPGDVIEVAPVIVIPETERNLIHQTILHDYYFIWPEGGLALALGYGSLYNHAEQPNAKIIFDTEAEEIIIECIQPISPGSEILIDYTDGTSEVKLWF